MMQKLYPNDLWTFFYVIAIFLVLLPREIHETLVGRENRLMRNWRKRIRGEWGNFNGK